MLRVAVARVPAQPATGDAAAPAWLGESERVRWAQLAPVARAAFVASRALLRALVSASTGAPQECWEVSAQAGSGPSVRPLRAGIATRTIHASLSHRAGWVAAAVADSPVGVDVELERPARTDPCERAALMLSPAELDAWESLPASAREATLLTRWTAKEAWFKASPHQDAAWDFRRIAARACAPADANVRTWTSLPLHVALCCTDAEALARVGCDGLDAARTLDGFWNVHRVAAAT